MCDRGKSVILLAVSIVVLLIMLIPSRNIDYHGLNDVVLVIANVLIIILAISTIFLILWILYRDDYKDIYLVRLALFIMLVLSLVVIYVFAMQVVAVGLKYVLLNFILILVNILDFVVENIIKVVKYKKDKTVISKEE